MPCAQPQRNPLHAPGRCTDAAPVTWQRRLGGGTMAFIGFLLSPLSWWNDAFINIPLAVGFGWLVALVHRPAFEAAVIVGYWLTNIIGLVLLQKGARQTVTAEPARLYTSSELVKDLLISLLYTGGIVVLLKLKILPSLPDLLHGDAG
jgi:hypothetical protein